MCFSPDSKFLLTQGAAPDWTLVFWAWEKPRVAAVTKSSNQQGGAITQCSFNPLDSAHMCVSGNGILKFFRYVDNQLKLSVATIGKEKPANYLCHTWMNEERIIVATDTGDLLLFDLGDLKYVFPTSPTDGNSIDSIIPYAKGFVCGGDGGVLSLYEKTDDKEYYRMSKQFKIENNAVKIKTLAITPSEDTLACALENGQLFQLSLSNTDMYKSDEMNFEQLAQPFHQGTITGVDVCIRKPLVATCSTDKSVRIWNYNDRSLDLVKYFSEEIHSIAFHPSGLHVLVGFSDKLRLMNLLMDDIRPYREFNIKACRECVFSNGGQHFAAVNSNTINVFNTYTCDNIGNLRGHNGKVRSVYWSADDQKIISAGLQGAVYEWSMGDFKRKGENVIKGCVYNCCLCVPDGRAILAVGSDKKIKEIADSVVNKDFPTGVELTQLCISSTGKMLFAGTATGTVRSYKYPLTSGEFQEFQCHSGPITRMRISTDDNSLFTVSEDGCLYIFDVRDKDKSKQQKEIVFAEEILVTKSDLLEKTALMAELKNKVDELMMQNEYQLRLKDMTYTEKIKDITDKYTAELEGEKSHFEVLLKEKNEIEIEYEERFKEQEAKHQQMLAQIEAQYAAKLMAEMERYQALDREKGDINDKWDEQTMLLVEGHEKVIQELTEDYENRIQEDQLMMDRLREEKEELGREFEETRRQLEEDADREIEELKDRYDTKLATERDASLRLKGENGIMRKKFNTLQKDIEDKNEEIKAQFDENQHLRSVITGMEKDIVGLRKEIRERDDTIGDKEKRIYDLKKKNQELEKFKFVLDYKIKELKKQIEPRELEMADMKDQIKEMDQELERYHKNNSNLELTINDLRLKLNGMQADSGLQRQRINDLEAIIRRFKTDLHECVQHIQDPKMLKESVKAVYQRHVTNEIKAAGMDIDIQKEYSRQREYLEKNLESLKRKLAKDSKLHKSDNMRIMQENVALIKEINELRREIRTILQQQQDKMVGVGNRSGRRPGSQQLVGQREIEMQREEIKRLRDRIAELEGGNGYPPRPHSREKLPPMEGFE
eukprot:TRINITY_DN334_c0_g1_i4.p1 TRINITY_DN334_c0_g1~~TRINITY_DN334_c0_g1_i4.p1  ORF type:complete len:1057 (+),score=414.00 TRINITY_DN334_c0_g1_i4:945-4115(+)